VGSLQVSRLGWSRPGGDRLFEDVSFRVGEGEHVALVGVNGVGKSTLLRLVSGDLAGADGTISSSGRMAVMPQLVGSIRDGTTIGELLASFAPTAIRAAAGRLAEAERTQRVAPDDTAAALTYAQAVSDWSEVGGFDIEVLWDVVCTKVIGETYGSSRDRPVASCSGGEQKRLALEALLRGDAELLLLDEPDNFLDVPGKRWLEDELQRYPKSVLFVSHDRELLAGVATKIVTIEAHGAWTHGGGFASYHQARADRIDRLARDAAQWQDERERLNDIVKVMRQRASISDAFAPRLKAAESRLRQFDERSQPPETVREQQVDVRIQGGRTGRKALMLEAVALHGLTDAFDAEIWYGERVAVLGPNGAGKSHFLRLIAGDGSIPHDGEVRLGARVVPGHFDQTHHHPEWVGRTLLQLLEQRDVVRGPAMGMLRRYGLQGCAEQLFQTLSGGQQARFQILLLELGGATLLALDEPTDNLDLESAEALEEGLDAFEGTVVAVTHDRWFLRGFDRFLVFDEDCTVEDRLEVPALYR
jgi:ATPase subunit of ABC transporter with duplicated ATPase domains